MTQIFQVYENDLGELEQILPQLAESLTPMMDGRLRVKLRRIQKILSDIRWNYGPPTDVEVIPSDGDADHFS